MYAVGTQISMRRSLEQQKVILKPTKSKLVNIYFIQKMYVQNMKPVQDCTGFIHVCIHHLTLINTISCVCLF